MKNPNSFLIQLFFLFLIGLCFKNIAYAQESVVIDSISQKITGKYLSIYIPQQEEELAQVVNKEFRIAKQKIPNLGLQKHSVWFKFSIVNNSFTPSLALSLGNNTITDAILYFKHTQLGNFDSMEVSNLKPLNVRKYKGSDIIFRLDKISDSTIDSTPQVYYLRIKSNQPIVIPIVLNLPADQLAQTVVKNWVNGIYFGMILIMAIYNFFLFISVRERSYLYYVAFILASGLTQLCLKGIAFQYFWPETPILEFNGMLILACLSGIFALVFTKEFLNIKKISTKWNNSIFLFILPFVASILFLIFGNFNVAFGIMRTSTSLSSLFILALAIYVLKHNKKGYAIYFLISWSSLILGSIIFILKDFNILPFNFFTNYSVQIFSVIEMTLLSFALANRINVLKKEKELTRVMSLKLARENERIVKEQNIILEKNVIERTSELNHTLEGLKMAQAKLVSAEKMSSLGQLTAGIAHEINNPINFVAANVKPLKRDVFQLFDLIKEVEDIYAQDFSLEEKLKKVELFKEEIDFDFLKAEITQLLKGIKDGASRTANIVKGLRAFSRQDDDEFVISDINAGLNSTLTISNNILKEITLEKELGDIPQVECNPGRLNQVFLNMVTNAIFAIHEQFGTEVGGKINIRTYSADEFVYISIKDNGIGMSEDTKSKLFDPFFTTKPIGEGTGLGMSIAFTFIEQHQGKLTVHSKEGVGTEILLQLPILQPKIKHIDNA